MCCSGRAGYGAPLPPQPVELETRQCVDAQPRPGVWQPNGAILWGGGLLDPGPILSDTLLHRVVAGIGLRVLSRKLVTMGDTGVVAPSMREVTNETLLKNSRRVWTDCMLCKLGN